MTRKITAGWKGLMMFCRDAPREHELEVPRASSIEWSKEFPGLCGCRRNKGLPST